MLFPTTQMGSSVEPNWTVLYDKIQGIENQITKLQELYDGRITTIADDTAKLKQIIEKWQSFSDMDNETESETDRKSDSDGDIIGHIQHTDAICNTDAASTEQADTSDFIGDSTLDLGREGSLIQQESCSANGLRDATIPKNLNEETPSEENGHIAAASTTVEPPENEPPGRDTGGETNCRRDSIAREDPEMSLYAEQQCNGIQEEVERDFTKFIESELPMTSDDLNFSRQPLNQRNQSIVGKPKEEVNPKLDCEYYNPLPLLTKKFPQTSTGYDVKYFKIERLDILIMYKNKYVRISWLTKSEELAEKLSQKEHKLKHVQNKQREQEIFEKVEREKETDHRNKDNKPGHWTGPDLQLAPNAHRGGADIVKDYDRKNIYVDSEELKESDSQASGGQAAAVYDDSDFHEERIYGERVHGLSTVICVDTSGSMEGEAFTDMKNAIHKILDDAEYTSSVYDFKELIGLVECGSGSDGRTVVSLTDNYDQIRRALDSLNPSGMSPLATGITEAVHEVKRHSGILVVSRQMVPDRVLVFTDGIPTDENDYERASITGKYEVMATVQHSFNEPVAPQARINFIGCGKKCDTVFLENAAKAGKGKFFRADDKLDVRRLGGYYRRLVWVCRFICPFREKKFINQLVYTINTFSTWMRGTKSMEMSYEDLSDFDMGEMYEILQELIGPKALTDLDIEDLQRTAIIQRELPLGIRVRRGRDWKYGDQDNDGPGTVSGYEKGGWVRVQWDHSNENFVYRYGHDECTDVQAVDEPRILRDDEFIKPGVKVRRSPHWNSGNNDGGPGSIGTVYKVEETGIVYVLWPTRVASNHCYGYDGQFEVELVEESMLHEGDEDGSDYGKVALWQWNSNGNWIAYHKNVNAELERSYRTRQFTCVEVNVTGLCQRINFESMTALCTDINETYEIQRTELSREDFEAVRVGLEGY